MKYAPRSATVPGTGETLRPVFGLDIDGTIGEYHKHFQRFAEAWVGRPLGDGEYYRGEKSFPEWLGLSKPIYRKVKLAYRRGGLKRSMPVMPGARDLAVSLRQAGALVVICTTRPFQQLEAVDEDTRHWLTRNGIQHDGLSLGEWKYRDLARSYGSRIFGVLDDLPEMYQQADSLGLNPILRRGPHNYDVRVEREAWGLNDAREMALEALSEWERAQSESPESPSGSVESGSTRRREPQWVKGSV